MSEKTVDAAGEFTFDFLRVGSYTIRIEAPGFKTYAATETELAAGQTVRRTFEMTIGSVGETVTVESRAKVESLLRDAAGPPRWRQVNHPSAGGGSDWPILYSTVQISAAGRGKAAGRTIAFGRDLRATEALQLRLIEAQQAMERDYWRFRQAETRYRHLFQASSEAVLIVDAGSLRILEANPAAVALVANGGGPRRLAGGSLTALFEAPNSKPLQAALAAARSARRAEVVRTALSDGGGRVGVSISSFRQDDASLLLVRLSRLGTEPSPLAAVTESSMLLDFVRNSPDALVFTDTEGRIQTANASFIALAQLGSEEQARGEPLDRWLGRTGVELGVLIQTVRQRGSMRLFFSAQSRSRRSGIWIMQPAPSPTSGSAPTAPR